LSARRGFGHCQAVLLLLLALDADLVVNLAHPIHVVRDLFDQELLLTAIHQTCQRDLTVTHGDFDLAAVQPRILAQAIADILADAVVGALVTLRSAKRALHRARDLLAGFPQLMPEALLLIVARVIIVRAVTLATPLALPLTAAAIFTIFRAAL
jgi:hypothetical protein